MTVEQVQELRALYNGDLASAPGVVALCDDWLRQTARAEKAEAAQRDCHVALGDLLEVTERMRGGDPTLDPEEWYATRDFARSVLRAALGETPA